MPAVWAAARELHRAVDAVAVGEGQRVHAVLGGALDQDVRVRGAVAQRVARGDVEVDEGIAGHGSRGLSLVRRFSGWTSSGPTLVAWWLDD